MLTLTRLKGQAVSIIHSEATLKLKYAKSASSSLSFEITGDLEDFELDGYINWRSNPIEAVITYDSALTIRRRDEVLTILVNYLRPERASINFGGPVSFKIRRDDLDSVS